MTFNWKTPETLARFAVLSAFLSVITIAVSEFNLKFEFLSGLLCGLSLLFFSHWWESASNRLKQEKVKQ